VQEEVVRREFRCAKARRALSTGSIEAAHNRLTDVSKTLAFTDPINARDLLFRLFLYG
jgi:hypothetical protein